MSIEFIEDVVFFLDLLEQVVQWLFVVLWDYSFRRELDVLEFF